MARFIHAADLHLDSPFSGLMGLPEQLWTKIHQSTFQALHRLVDGAIQEQVDFVLLAGDIYDLEDRSIKAQAVFREEMNRLRKESIPVFMIHGNHDFLAEEELHLEMPDNVKVFSTKGETVQFTTKRGEKVAVSGFSYPERWVMDRKVQEYPSRYPSVDWHIGLLHGYSESSRSQHAHYAPFSISELQEKGYDYWALGHIHSSQKVSDHPLAYYPGALQGRNKKETGPKGYLQVTLSSTEKKVESKPAASIVWENIEIELWEVQSIDDVYQSIHNELQSQRADKINKILTITLIGTEDFPATIQKKIENGELLEAFQPTKLDLPFLWVNDLSFVQKKAGKVPALKALFPEEWKQALNEVQSENVFREVTNDFFQQTKYASMLERRHESYRESVMEKALEHLYAAMGIDDDED